MKIVWSKAAQRACRRIDTRYQVRIENKLAKLDDRSAPQPDIRKITAAEYLFRLRVGDYRVIFALRGTPDKHCYVIAVKRRTTTTYSHEENRPYGCSTD